MRTLDLHRAHAAAGPEPLDESHELALQRRVARKAAASSTTGDPSTGAAIDAFGAAINAGIHPIARKGSGDFANDAGSLLASAAGSSGQQLPSDIRRKFESSLGADLSSVRLHDGAQSAAASSAISARAYTTGSDIHFAAGQYDPGSQAGEHLLAHEVAHTVQQAAAGPSTQRKLEVSEPGDACEVEADRAADAMLAGQTFAISGASGVQRAIMRTEDEEGAGEGEGEGTGGGGGGGGGDRDGESETVNTTWTINYDQLHTGNSESAQPRTADSALHVTHFGVRPANGSVSPATPFSGYNLQPAGSVTMGSRRHPRGQAGQASAAISYLRQRAVDIAVVGGDRAALRRLGTSRSALERGIERAVAERVRGSVDSGLFDDASLTALLPDAARAAGLTVRATSREPARDVVNAEPLQYPAIQRDQEMHVSVHVPTAEAVVRGTSSEDHDEETTTGEHEGTTTRDETEVTTESTTRNQLVTTIGTSYRRECERFARVATETLLRGRGTGRIEGSVRGEGEATLQSAIAGTLPLRTILAIIPQLRRYARLAGDASITSSIDQTFRLLLELQLGGSLELEVEASQREEVERSLRSTIETQLTTQWETTLSNDLRVALQVTHGEERAEGTTGGTRTEDRRHREGSFERRGTSQSSARPELRLTNEVAGPEAPRVPQRVE